jgi:hypothetical protein
MVTKVLFIFLFFCFGAVFAQQSLIAGRVEDASSGEILIGANVVVNERSNTGGATDANGNFRISVPVGSYSIKVSSVGYAPMVKTDVIVKSGKESFVVIKLNPTNVELNEVVVQSDYFDKSIQVNNLATVVLSSEEIRRSPGSAQDFQRILQGMAGVSFSNDQNNELLVRGGSPNENLTVYDNMELHSTNHYPNEMNSGGPINMVNVDLIENIQFSTGGFISKYGDKLSSVMSIETREGTRNSLLKGNVNLSMAGAGVILEGGINNGKGSWVFSARKSYIDLIAGSFGLTAIPKYYDFQFKAGYDLSPMHHLSISGIYGNDKILFDGEADVTREWLANGKDSVGYNRIDVKQSQFAIGTSLKSIWSKNFYSLVTVYHNNFKYFVDVDENYVQRSFDASGKSYDHQLLNSRKIVQDNHHAGILAGKSEFVWKLSNEHELSFGGYLGSGDFVQDVYVFGDSARYWLSRFNAWSPTVVTPFSQMTTDIKYFDHQKYYVFANDKIKFFDDRVLLNIGFRYDYFSYSEKGNVSPRVSASYYIIPGITNFNLAYGEYYQTQSYPTYGPLYGKNEDANVNRYLRNTHARHYVAGFEHILDDGLKVTLEGYYKQYSDIPVTEQFIHFFDRMYRSNITVNTGKQNAYGIDLMIQQKLVEDYYGTLSYSKMLSKMKDPRIGREGKEYTSDYEFPNILTLIFGKRFADLRKNLDEMPFYIKYPSMILPFSDDMEISVRYRYASGKVYTPKEWKTDEQYYEGGVRWSKGNWVENDEINSARYPDYHRLDIALNSRYNFEKWSLSVYLSIQNLYNRKNIAGYQYNSDGTRDNIYQFSLLPVAGIEVNF